ncbi:MAG: tyrosine-type recombinase/integrase, partial [Verrucomicrobiales bacterium]
MASVHKRSHSPFWYATFMRADGRRAYKSTGKKSRRDAIEVAVGWEKPERTAKKAARSMQPELADIIVRAAGQANRGELTIDRARQHLMSIYELSSGEAYPSYTVSQWLEQWLSSNSLNVSESTMRRYRNSVKCVQEALGAAAEKQLELLTTDDLRKAQETLHRESKATGGRVATVNYKIQDARAAIRSAHEQGLINRDVGSPIKALPEEDSAICTSFTVPEIESLIVHAKGDWKGAILIAAHTGLRMRNVAELSWDEIDLVNGRMTVCPVKQKRNSRKKTVTIPLSQSVASYLARSRANPRGPLFPDLTVKPSSTLSNQFGVLMKRASIPRQVRMPGGETGSRSFHSLRHSYISFMANAQVPAEVRRSLAAHDSAAVHEGYTHHDHETL